MNKYNFCHLHRHCEASIQDGVGKVEDGVRYAKEMGHPAIAVTDHGSLISYVRFQNEAKLQGIKHIFGLEAYVCDDMAKKDKEHKDYNHCTILVKNQQGLLNVLKLNNLAQDKGFYYKPRIDWDTLLRHKEGLIVLSGCVIGRTCQYILAHKYDEADAWTRMMRKELGEDYYIETMVSDFEAQKECNQYLLELSRKFDIPAVVTGDAHYTRKEDYEAQKVMMLISAKATVQELEEQQRKKAEAKARGQSQEEKDRIWIFESDQYWMKTENEMIDSWREWHQQYYPFNEFEQHLNESGKIADKVEEVLLDDSYKMPKADIEGNDHEEYFLKKLRIGMDEKQFSGKKEYEDELQVEIDVIKQKGLIDYFLVTGDVIKWAKDNDIFVGPGRGSAGGSLVSYLLGITDIDPIQHGLLFERFLDLGRQEMPDIDTDFEIDRRDEVKQYIAERYGKEYVAAVSAFGTFRAKNIVRDIARVYGVDPQEINIISKLIKDDCIFNDGEIYLGDDVYHNQTLDIFWDQHPQIKRIASTLFGQIRHVSKHAAGVIVTNKPLDECVPTINVGGEIMTAWSEGLYRKELSQLNFLKLDILGLKTLSIIKMACNLAGLKYQDLIKLDKNDFKVYELINKNKLICGIFQFDSSTGSWLYDHMKPKNFNDLIALGALDRPGPLDSFMAFEYVDKMYGRLHEEWSHPAIDEVLGETYGVIVYQEQLMTLGKKLAGFSPIEASRLRKSLVKVQLSEQTRKKAEKERKELKEIFFERAIEHGAKKRELNKLWTAMLKFARYGFNKAHAAGYAYITYWTMWLKTYYPLQFYTALLTYSVEDDIPQIIREMGNKMGISLQNPDINSSGINFTFDADQHRILYGLAKIKYVGTKAQNAIIENRPFKSFDDLCERIPKNILNKRAKEALIRTGAFRKIEEDPGALLTKIESEGLTKKQKAIFDWNPRYIAESEKIKNEMFYLGVSPTNLPPAKRRGGHVAIQYREYRNTKDSMKTDSFAEKFKKNSGEFTFSDTGIIIERFCGYVMSVDERHSKNGHQMLVFTLDVYDAKPMKLFIMNWDKHYKEVQALQQGDPVGVAIYKRKTKGEFPKIYSVFKFNYESK